MNATEIKILITLILAYIYIVSIAWKVYRMPLGNDENIGKKNQKLTINLG